MLRFSSGRLGGLVFIGLGILAGGFWLVQSPVVRSSALINYAPDFSTQPAGQTGLDEGFARPTQGVDVATQVGSTPSTYLVTFDQLPSVATVAAAVGVAPTAVELHAEAKVASVTTTAPLDHEELSTLPGAVSVEEDEPFAVLRTPNDPNVSSQESALTQIGAYTAWDYVQGKSTAVIAVLDTGVNGTHPDLIGKVITGKNILTGATLGANTDSDDNGHGTNIAGVAAATGNNGVGMAGIDWNASIMPVKAFDSQGVATTSDIIEGISYAAANGATVIVMSFGRSTPSEALASAINAAADRGVLLVAAAGNDGAAAVSYPAAYENVIGVGAVDASGNRASFSNYGPELDLVAPGVSVYATGDNQDYGTASGTSLAAPFVAGVVTLIKDFHSSASRAEIMSILQESATRTSGMGGAVRTDQYGYGIVNAAGAATSAGSYVAEITGWSSSDGGGVYPSVDAGGTGTNITLSVRNAGTSRWFRGIVHLGTDQPRDRGTGFLRESLTGATTGWLSQNRIEMVQSSVAPGETATFSFWLAAPAGMSPGTYREHYRLVADGIDWFGPELYWDVRVRSALERYQAAPAGWIISSPTLTRGGTGTNIVWSVRNTGSATWTRGTVNLGTAQPLDRGTGFLRESRTGAVSGWLSQNRIEMVQSSVAPGETATFSFWLAAPAGMSPGTYREHYRLVADGLGWLPDYGIFWDLVVQ